MKKKYVIIDDIYALVFYDKNNIPYIKTCLTSDNYNNNVFILSDKMTYTTNVDIVKLKKQPIRLQKTFVSLNNSNDKYEFVKVGTFGVDLYYKNCKPFIPSNLLPSIKKVRFNKFIAKSLNCDMIDFIGVTTVDDILKYEKKYNKALKVNFKHHNKICYKTKNGKTST